MSMSAGEFVSVSSQVVSEGADLDRERTELSQDPQGERNELAGIYMKRGLDRVLAIQAAEKLMAHDALSAHARDELGISDSNAARPVQAALTSAASFAVGAALPLAVAIVAPIPIAIVAVSISSLIFLALLGLLGAKIGGAHMLKAAVRVMFWGALAMAVTAAIGAVFGARARVSSSLDEERC
jgi:VIT1/CCC1 family predicted Fe2+/Mn2+ transporter